MRGLRRGVLVGMVAAAAFAPSTPMATAATTTAATTTTAADQPNTRARVTHTWRYWPISVEPTSAAKVPNQGTAFHGNLRNRGTTTLRYPSVMLMFYGSDGRIMDIATDTLSKSRLAPGATTSYLVTSNRAGPHAFFRSFVSADGTPPRA